MSDPEPWRRGGVGRQAVMTGPVTRWLRRPVSWKAGLTVADVLFLLVFGGAGAAVIVLVLIASRDTP